MRRFVESSALVKRYVNETGNQWISGIVDPASGNAVYVADISEVEVTSAVRRRQRGGSIPAADAAAMLRQFRIELANHFRSVTTTSFLVSRAAALADTHGLRSADALQLSAALEVEAQCLLVGVPFALVSADDELNAAAQSEGLLVENPLSHP